MKNNSSVWILLALIALLFPTLIIVTSGFPYLGIATCLIILASLVYFFKSPRSRWNKSIFITILLLGFCIIFRANPFLTFLNITAIIFLGSILSLPQTEPTSSGFFYSLLSPFTLFFRTIRTPSKYTFKPHELSQGKFNVNGDTISTLIKSLVITIPLLIVITALLSSANPLFSKLVVDTIKVFNIDQLLEKLFSENYFVWLVRLTLSLILVFLLPRLLTYINKKEVIQNPFANILSAIHFLIPKISISIILLIFFIMQAQLYFSSEQTLKMLGITHSQYAREVFTQLTIVTIIVIGLIYNDKSRSKWARISTLILIIQGIFLACIALKSVYDYSTTWGLTYKRLWGYTGVVWVVCILLLFTYKYLKNLSDHMFVKRTILVSSSTLILVNLLNFDYLIYHYGKSTTESGTDYAYLTRLSPDAHAYADLFSTIKPNTRSSSYFDYSPRETLITQIASLQNKYAKLDLRTFNISEYFEYLSIKNIDITHEISPRQTSYLVPNSTPSPTPNTPSNANPKKIASDKGYQIILPEGWSSTLYPSGEFEWEIKNAPVYSTISLYIRRAPDPAATAHPFYSEHYTVDQWVMTTFPQYFLDPRTGQPILYQDTKFETQSGPAIMRTLPDISNGTVYLPLKDNVLIVDMYTSGKTPKETDLQKNIIKETLKSYIKN